MTQIKKTSDKNSTNLFSIQIANEAIESARGLSLREIRESELIPMSQMRKENGVKSVLQSIRILVGQFVESMNLLEKTNRQVISAIAEDIYDIAYMCSFKELVIFFKELRQGKYGSSYQNINSEFVVIALNKFLIKRQDFFAKKSDNEFKASGNNINDIAEFVVDSLKASGYEVPKPKKQFDINEYRKWKKQNSL